MAGLSGVVKVAGQFARRKVRVYLRSTGDLVAETFSLESNGTWSVTGITTDPHFVVVLDV